MLGLILLFQVTKPPSGEAGLEARREQLVGAREAPAAFRPGIEPVTLLVRDAVGLALQNNLELEIARFAPLQADQDIEIAWGAFDWVAHAEPNFLAARLPAASLLSDQRLNLMAFNAGVRQVTRIGIAYDLTTTADRTSVNNVFTTLNPTWRQSLGIELRMPTLRGLGLDGQYSFLTVARNNLTLTEVQFEQKLLDTVYAVERAYWEIYLAREVLREKQEGYDVTAKLLQANRDRLAAGTVALTAVTRAEADLAIVEEEIIIARTQLDNATDALWVLAQPDRTRIASRLTPILTSDVPPEPGPPVDEDRIVEDGLIDAIARRPELAALKIRRENQEVIVMNKEDAEQPKLDLVGGARYQGLSRHFDETLLDSTFDTDTHSWHLGLLVEVPLGNWQARADRIKAELEGRRIEVERRKTEDTIVVDLRKAARGIKAAEQRIETARKRVETARVNYEAEEDRLKVGASSSFEVLSALQLHTAAQIGALRSRVDRHVADLDMEKAAGTLLMRRGIVTEGQLGLRGAF